MAGGAGTLLDIPKGMRQQSTTLSLLGLYSLLAFPTAWAAPSASQAPSLPLRLRGTFYSGALNINTATLRELLLLPGIGRSTAAAIVSYRQEQGGIRTLDELLSVPGIGPKKLARLRPYLKTFGPSDFCRAGKTREKKRSGL